MHIPYLYAVIDTGCLLKSYRGASNVLTIETFCGRQLHGDMVFHFQPFPKKPCKKCLLALVKVRDEEPGDDEDDDDDDT